MKIKKRFALLIFLCFLMTVVLSYTYSEDGIILGEYIVYQRDFSNNKNFLIETRVHRGNAPELFLLNMKENVSQSICAPEMAIIYTPKVNDRGDFSYVKYINSNAFGCELFFNNRKIAEGNKIEILDISDEYLFYYSYKNNLGGNPCCLYQFEIDNETTKIIKEFNKERIVRGVFDIVSECLLLNYWDETIMNNIVVKYEIKDGKITNAEKYGNKNEMAILWQDNSQYYVELIKFKNDNSKYLYNAYFFYYLYQSGEPFSITNNYGGRISWNESYRLLGLIELYEKTSNMMVLQDIEKTINGILSVTNKNLKVNLSKEQCLNLWSTKKYSISKETKLNLLVDDAMILWPLVKAVNSGMGEEVSAKIIQTAEELFCVFEKDYFGGNYFFEKGIDFSVDGICLPWNQQNAMGLMLIELYKNTGNEKYYRICREMITSFKNEWIVKDNYIAWHYWPIMFYEGWSIIDEISLNTPSKNKTEDLLLEDVSHAGLNLEFILSYHDTFKDNIISCEDINKISNNINKWCFKDGFARFISGDIEYSPKGYNYHIPHHWAKLKNDHLDAYFTSLHDHVNPDFDNMSLLIAYAVKYDPDIEVGFEYKQITSSEFVSMKVKDREQYIEYFINKRDAI